MASCFNILIGIRHIRYFFFTFCPAIIWTWETSIEDWKMVIRWCRIDICSCKLSAKVSLMLDKPFLVLSLCKWTISAFVSSRLARNHLQAAYSLQGKRCFFWSHPRCFGLLGKLQHNIKISIKTAHISRLSLSYDYDSGLKTELQKRNISLLFRFQWQKLLEKLLFV